MKKLLLTVLLGMLLVTTQAQNCIRVTSAAFTNPSGDNVTWRLTLNYIADGTKHLVTTVLVSNDTVLTSCFETRGNNATTGTLIYDSIIAPGGLPTLRATIDRYTGGCGQGIKCDSSQSIINNVLELKVLLLDARNYNNDTRVTFKVLSIDETNAITFNFTLPDGKTKKHRIVLSDVARPGDVWVVTVNNIDGTYTTKKL